MLLHVQTAMADSAGQQDDAGVAEDAPPAPAEPVLPPCKEIIAHTKDNFEVRIDACAAFDQSDKVEKPQEKLEALRNKTGDAFTQAVAGKAAAELLPPKQRGLLAEARDDLMTDPDADAVEKSAGTQVVAPLVKAAFVKEGGEALKAKFGAGRPRVSLGNTLTYVIPRDLLPSLPQASAPKK